MNHANALKILILLLNLGNLESVTVVNHHPDEEYFLEHEVLYEDAIAEAKKLKVYPGTKLHEIPTCVNTYTRKVLRSAPCLTSFYVWSIKHLYEAQKSIYLSSENNFPLICLNGYFRLYPYPVNELRRPLVFR